MAGLTRKERWTFSIVLPMIALTVGYFLVIATTDGQGSSIGFRALGALIAFPVALIVTFVFNFLVALPRENSRSGSFAFGMIAPVLILVAEYAFLWQVWEMYPDIS